MNIYEAKERILYNDKDILKLSKKDGKLLMLLSDNEMHSIEEINRFLYGKTEEEYFTLNMKGIHKIYYEKDKFTSDKVIITLIYRLKKKLRYFYDIKIKNHRELGYKMEGDVYIT